MLADAFAPLTPVHDCGLCGYHLDDSLDGLSWERIRAEFQHRDESGRPDGGVFVPFEEGNESWAELVARVGRALTGLATRHAGGTVLAVMHKESVEASLIAFGALPLYRDFDVEIGRASITEWVTDDDPATPWDLERGHPLGALAAGQAQRLRASGGLSTPPAGITAPTGPNTSPEAEPRRAPRMELAVSYLFLRRAIGLIGSLLPIVLPLGYSISTGKWQLLSSVSSYYYTDMRNVFVGSLCAVGVFLICYRYEHWDDVITTLAGAFAIAVAFFPTTPANPSALARVVGVLHDVFAVGFFVAMALMCLLLFTRSNLPPAQRTPQKHAAESRLPHLRLADPAVHGAGRAHRVLPEVLHRRRAPAVLVRGDRHVRLRIRLVGQGPDTLARRVSGGLSADATRAGSPSRIPDHDASIAQILLSTRPVGSATFPHDVVGHLGRNPGGPLGPADPQPAVLLHTPRTSRTIRSRAGSSGAEPDHDVECLHGIQGVEKLHLPRQRPECGGESLRRVQHRDSVAGLDAQLLHQRRGSLDHAGQHTNTSPRHDGLIC